jgi:hypothetical protein
LSDGSVPVDDDGRVRRLTAPVVVDEVEADGPASPLGPASSAPDELAEVEALRLSFDRLAGWWAAQPETIDLLSAFDMERSGGWY